MFCNQCGTRNDDNLKFCTNCGSLLPVAPVQQPIQQPVQQPVQWQVQQPVKKKKGAVIGFILVPIVLVIATLCIVLGIFIGKGDSKPALEDPEEEIVRVTKEYTEESTGESLTTEPVDNPEDLLADRTVMVYMIGSNLESESGLATQDIDEMLLADSSEKFKIVLQTGGCTEWFNEEIKGGRVQRFEIKDNRLEKLQDLGKVSMVETATLTDFITFAKENYPAKEYVLVMWNHGGGIPIGFGWDELFPGELTDVEIGQAIEAADIHFEALIFNACEMCSLELFMAIKDHVDYVVAAESSVYGYGIYGSGINHTNWMNMAIDPDISTQDYCETILDDYMEFLEKIKSQGSMSVIRMDRIEEVYQAYVTYLSAVYQDMQSKEGYAAFIRARDDCGLYEGTDVVDISTLAEKYENEYSTALQNAVTNAVVRTKSDISYGHGITVYSPYKYADFYNEGRQTFVNLQYDQTIFDFYDLLASKLLFYDDKLAYAGDWYVDQKDTSGESQGDGQTLAFTDMGDYEALALTKEDWEIVKGVRMFVAQDITDPQLRYLYGSETQYELDENGYIQVARPEYWLFINDYIPTSYCQYYDSDEEEWYKISFVLAYVNGEEAYIRVDSGSTNSDGLVKGYYLCDFESEVYDEGHSFTGEEEVQLAAEVYEGNTKKVLPIGIMLKGDGLEAKFTPLAYGSSEEVLLYFEVEDVYGNVYTTDVTTTNR